MEEGMLAVNTGIESINATDYNRTPKSKLILIMWGATFSS